MSRAGRVAAFACALAILAGCVTTSTRSVGANPSTIQARHNLKFMVPPGWTLTESPMHFFDSVQVSFRSPEGMAVVLEVSAGEAVELDKRVDEVRRAYAGRFPDGRFHPVKPVVGIYPAMGFDGSVVTSGPTGRRLNFLYRCFNASGRFVSIQGRANAAVWSVRRAELEQFLHSLRIGPGPRR